MPIDFTATAVDTAGKPYAGKTMRYTITGVNPGDWGATLGPDRQRGDDPSRAPTREPTRWSLVDFNDNGAREPAEPQASALGTFVDNVPPTCTVKVCGDRPGGAAARASRVDHGQLQRGGDRHRPDDAQPRSSRSRAATVDKKARSPRKKVTIKLKTSTVTVQPGPEVPMSLKLSSAVRKKYAGKTLTATITVTARDASGNVKKTKATRTVKLAKLKKSKANK